MVLGCGRMASQSPNTLLMAYLATVLGTIIGGAISFFAARNLAHNYLVYWVARRVLEIARTVPDIVWALLFVLAFGIGEVAGILAITSHTLGAQDKLFAEVNENISPLPIDGIRSAGGNWFQKGAYTGAAELPFIYILAHQAVCAARRSLDCRRRREA